MRQGCQSACCSRLLWAEGAGLLCCFPWGQKEPKARSGKSQACSPKAVPRCLSADGAAGVWPGGGVRSTAPRWGGGGWEQSPQPLGRAGCAAEQLPLR